MAGKGTKVWPNSAPVPYSYKRNETHEINDKAIHDTPKSTKIGSAPLIYCFDERGTGSTDLERGYGYVPRS